MNTLMQIAFADGYLAASKKPDKSSKWKIFSTFKDAVGFLLLVVVLLAILGMYSDDSS